MWRAGTLPRHQGLIHPVGGTERSHIINDWCFPPSPSLFFSFVSGSPAPEQGLSSFIVWLICGILARGNLPFEVVTRAWVIIIQWLNILATTLLLSHWGTKHTKALLLLHALRVAISKGFFFFFSPCQLCFSKSFIMSSSCFTSYKVQPWPFVQNPPPFHS